jgi:CheY-like chemotaxis protein
MSGARVLIVEDEMLVAMFVEDLLGDLGYQVAGVVSHIDDGMKRAEQGDFDIALLDVHLNGKEVFPLADILAGKNIPFIFATGYGERGLPDRYRGRPVLQKPYHPDDLAAILGKTKPA